MYIILIFSKLKVSENDLLIIYQVRKKSEWSAREAYEVKAPLLQLQWLALILKKALKTWVIKSSIIFPYFYKLRSSSEHNYLLVLCFSALWIAAAFSGNILHLSFPLVFTNTHNGKGYKRCKTGKQTCCLCLCKKQCKIDGWTDIALSDQTKAITLNCSRKD